MDPFAVEVGNGGVATIVFAVGDALGNALVRPGRVVTAPGIRSGRSVGGARRGSACGRGSRGVGCRGARRSRSCAAPGRRCAGSWCQRPGRRRRRMREVRSAVADQELNVLEPLIEAGGEVAGLLHGPLAGGVRGDPPRCIRRVPCSMNTRTYSLLRRRCPRVGNRLRRSRRPGRAETAASSDPSGAVLD